MKTMSKKGVLTIVSGFSGAGKGTLMKAIVKKYEYQLSISATTRAPREGEVHGREYFFLTREEFEDMIKKDQLYEWAEYVGNYYGTPKKYVEEQLAAGKDVILEIETQGALKVKEQYPEALLLFVTPPTIMELERRLIGRGTETMDVIKKRLSQAVDESSVMRYYDYLIINDNLEECVEQMHQVIVNEHNKVSKNKEFIEAIQAELTAKKRGEI